MSIIVIIIFCVYQYSVSKGFMFGPVRKNYYPLLILVFFITIGITQITSEYNDFEPDKKCA